MYSDDLPNDPMVSDQEDDADPENNLGLEAAEVDDDENAYLVNDEEISEGFQFQS